MKFFKDIPTRRFIAILSLALLMAIGRNGQTGQCVQCHADKVLRQEYVRIVSYSFDLYINEMIIIVLLVLPILIPS